MRSNAWLSGRNDSATSSWVTSSDLRAGLARSTTRLACVSITPFGSPVVPEV